jgi:aromatic-L-amino-acid decarboxylase
MRTGPESADPADFVLHEIRSFRAGIRRRAVAEPATAAEIRQRLARYDMSRPMPLVETLRDVADLLRRWTLHATHPRYLGLFVPNVHEAGIWADALSALYNPQLGAWWHAPAANEIERHTLRLLADVLGYPAGAAHFTTGGSEANLTALLGAIAAAFPHAPQRGVAEATQGGVYLSTQAHHSLHKAVGMAGLGRRAIREIPVNARHEMDPCALHEALERDRAAGRRPIMIAATVGTTIAGAIDDLVTIGGLARAHGAWFHVDAAWGGAAAFSARLRPLFRGIADADSVTWDAHKWLSVPMGAGMLFCRRPEALRRVFEVATDYVPEQSPEGEDLYLGTAQWSRRFTGLRVFVTLVTLGCAGVAARIERQLGVADHLRRRLLNGGWTVMNHSPLPLVCFAHPSLGTRAAVDAVARRVAGRGRAWISAATLPQGPVLRACVTNDDTTPADAEFLCEELERSLAPPP